MKDVKDYMKKINPEGFNPSGFFMIYCALSRHHYLVPYSSSPVKKMVK